MEIKKIGVIGSGIMGAGIAQVAAVAGVTVILNDIDQKFIDKGMGVIKGNLDKSVAKGKMTADDMKAALGRISTTLKVEDFAGVDLVIEAATENRNIKLDLFKKLDGICPAETILATNTSSISITEIGAVTKRPDKIVGLHFFNPVPAMKLLEIVKGFVTSEDTIKASLEFAKKIGKETIVAQDSPGFIVNRILLPLINEASYLLYEGVGTPEDIDRGLMLGANHPMGPLALGDLVGLDTIYSALKVLHEGFGESKYRPCPLLKKMVAAGHYGRKSGRGFYVYNK